MSTRQDQAGFTVLELALSLVMVSVLLAVLLPALTRARGLSAVQQCQSNLHRAGSAWQMYLEDHDQAFPHVPVQPAWHYAGVRFSTVDGSAFLDPQRPLNAYLFSDRDADLRDHVLHCPADRGITVETGGVGTGRRSAFRSFGTSYRANAHLLRHPRGLRRDEIATVPTRLVVMGDPIWYEVRAQTGRDAAWHGEERRGNLLFLDGSVKSMNIFAPPRVGPDVYEPKLRQQ